MKNIVRHTWFPLLWTLIVGVSLYDAWLIVEYAEQIRWLEENPIGTWLILMNNGDVSLFVRTKLAGTILVGFILLILRRWRYQHTLPVTSSLAACQSALFCYLSFV